MLDLNENSPDALCDLADLFVDSQDYEKGTCKTYVSKTTAVFIEATEDHRQIELACCSVGFSLFLVNFMLEFLLITTWSVAPLVEIDVLDF